MTTIKRAFVALAILFVFFPEDARASGFSTARFGSEHGNPTESNPTALYYNPAGIGFSEGTQLFVEGQLALRHATWEHQQAKTDVPEPAGATGANFGKATLTNVFGAPALGVTTKVGDLALGAGVFVPFGGRASWDPNEAFRDHPTYPLAVDGVQRWHGIDGAITFLYLTAGAAYKIGPLSIGASGNFILSSVQFTLAKTLVNGDNDMDAEGRSQLDVKRNIGSFAVGAMYEVLEQKLWIGASYQAAPGLGDITMKGTLTISQGDAQLVRDVDFHQSMPDVFRFGARYRPVPDWEVRLFGDFTRWSRLVSQCISIADQPCEITRTGASAPGAQTVNSLYRGWSDTIGVRLGVSHWFTSAIEGFVGAGFESSAVPDSTLEPTLFDSNTISGAIGGRFEVAERLWLGLSYTHLQYLARDNTGKSILADPAVDPITRRVDGGGKYTAFVGVGALSLEKRF